VLVGWVETHGRPETQALLAGLPVLPPRETVHRGAALRELDLDAALARRPALLLVDELAHTNAPGARHAKRWQDVTELLDAGIDVHTTLNVQHLESLNDVVTQITGVVVRETVPDALFDQADEVELVDLPAEELRQRLREGKVYIGDQAVRAVEHFFRAGNLIALRELALRRTAERVDAQMQAYRLDHAIARAWPAAERLIVGVSASPLSPRMVRAAGRMARGLRAEWLAVHVETPATLRQSPADRERVIQTLRLAESLGAESVTLQGARVEEELLAYARRRNVGTLLVGKPTRRRWRDRLGRSLLDDLVRRSGDVDVYVISGEEGPPRPAAVPGPPVGVDWRGHAWALLAVALATAIAWVMFPYFELADLIMVYLSAIILVASRLGRAPSLLASLASVAAFDFCFIPPYLTFAVSDVRHAVTFAVMLVTGVVLSNLTARIRQQATAARERERRTAVLHALARELASSRDSDQLAAAGVRHLGEAFGTRAAVLVPEDGRLVARAGALPQDPDQREVAVSRWVFDHGQMAGAGTATLPGASALYLPLPGSQGPVGVLAITPPGGVALRSPEQLHFLEAFASQIAVALERTRLATAARQAEVQVEAERLRTALLSAVSHDLRTPLAGISGAASSLLAPGPALGPEARDELLRTIHEEAERLNRLVGNLLHATRLQAGAVEVRKDWHPLEEIVGAALGRAEGLLAGRPVAVSLAPELPLVPLDGVLVEQVLVNLVENALRHAPGPAPIEVTAWPGADSVTVEVADRGPGLPAGAEARIFESFVRDPAGRGTGGAGLGLTVCRGIVEAHGGRIWAEARPGGGLAVRFTLPRDGKPPELPADDA
jgi:two-component system sensor histidine kinase KdpD